MAKIRGAMDPDAGVRSRVMTPAQIAGSGTEHAHQCAIMQWIATIGTDNDGRDIPNLDLVYAVPNGGDRRISVAAALKAEGVRSGVPDLVWPVPCGRFAGLYLELKLPKHAGTKNGGRSDNQIKWHKRLREQQYAVVTAYGWQAAVSAIRDYWATTLLMPEGDDCAFYLPRELPT